MKAFSFEIVLICLLTGILGYFPSYAQTDTVTVSRNHYIILKDYVYYPKDDTVFVFPKGTKYHVRYNPFVRSARFYDSLKAKTQQSRLSRELFSLLIRMDHKGPVVVDDLIKSESYFKGNEGKLISSIKIMRTDLYEGNVMDTTMQTTTYVSNMINRYHVNTRRSVIYRNLLFGVGDNANPYQLADNERILRNLDFVEDARIVVTESVDNPEHIDLTIVIKDKFPMGAGLSSSSLGNLDASVFNKNILGSGNQAEFSYLYNKDEPTRQGYEIRYISSRFKNSFTNLEYFLADNWERKGYGATIAKDFVNPGIKYGGELSYANLEEHQSEQYLDSMYNFRTKKHVADLWVSRALQYGKRGRKNVFLSAQYLHRSYAERPLVKADSNYFYHNTNMSLFSLSSTRRNFLKTKNLFTIGVTEDVPVGHLYELTYGHEVGEFDPVGYIGSRSINALYVENLGYLALTNQVGTFIRQGRPDNTVVQSHLQYFTPYLQLHRYGLRVFGDFHHVAGYRTSLPSQLTLDDLITPSGSELSSRGNKMTLGKVDVRVYFPWYFYGFWFSMNSFFHYGTISENRIPGIGHSRITNYGIGCKLINESLVIQSLTAHIGRLNESTHADESLYFTLALTSRLQLRHLSNIKPGIISLNGSR